jgi:hypothetical protein
VARTKMDYFTMVASVAGTSAAFLAIAGAIANSGVLVYVALVALGFVTSLGLVAVWAQSRRRKLAHHLPVGPVASPASNPAYPVH